MATRRRDNSPAGRLMRQAVAYDRLAAKAHRNGQQAASVAYARRSMQLKWRVTALRERKDSR